MSYTITSEMQMVDLSHPWGNNQPTWPAGAQPYTTPVQYMSKFNRLTQLMYGFPQHVSTHYDAPAHVIQESPFCDEVALDKFMAPAVILDIPCTKWQTITKEMLAAATPKIEKGDYVIVVTGYHKVYGDNDRYFLDSPGLDEEAALWLVEQGVTGFGIDCQALDHPCASYMVDHGPGPLVPRLMEAYKKETGHMPKEDHPKWEPVHEVFLSRNIPAFENVGGDVEMVKGKRCVVCAFPSRWYMGDGSIVRMIAFIDKKDINPGVEKRIYKYGTY